MKDVENISVEQLKKKQKIITTGTIILAGVILVFFIFMIMDYAKTKEFNLMLIIPIASSFIVISNIMKINTLRNELKSKKL